MNPKQLRERLTKAIGAMPINVEQDDPQGGVLRPWVRKLPLRFQGVLVTAIRGCDGAPKEDPSKSLSRMIRRAVLNPADPRESLKEGGFFGFSVSRMLKDTEDLFHSLDQYPLHYVMHLCHASQIIGYCHPKTVYQDLFETIYFTFCLTFHLQPEMFPDMETRLTEDRVQAGTVERSF